MLKWQVDRTPVCGSGSPYFTCEKSVEQSAGGRAVLCLDLETVASSLPFLWAWISFFYILRNDGMRTLLYLFLSWPIWTGLRHQLINRTKRNAYKIYIERWSTGVGENEYGKWKRILVPLFFLTHFLHDYFRIKGIYLHMAILKE